MRVFLSRCVCVGCVLGCISACRSGSAAEEVTSVLVNGDFTQTAAGAMAPEGWTVGDWSPEAQRGSIRVSCSPAEPDVEGAVATIGYEGAGTNLVLYQDLSGPESRGYRLSVRTRAPTGVNVWASAVLLKEGKILQYENTKQEAGTGAWQDLVLAFPVTDLTAILRIILRATAGGAQFASAQVVADAAAAQAEPSTGRELATKKADDLEYDLAADDARKAAMTPEELAWETVLEANLGSFYLPRYKQVKLKGGNTAWDYVKDDPALPRVLLIGDSVSRGYTAAVRHALAGKANVHRAPANCGPTAAGIKQMDVWLGDGAWDLVHFNFGIHDRNSAPVEYAQRLEEIVVRLKGTGAKLVWASSTPLSGTMLSAAGEDPMVALNAAAAVVMTRHGVAIDDLHAVAAPILETIQTSDGCHFMGEGYDVLGGAVAERILAEVNRK